jgi:hypothetical protein
MYRKIIFIFLLFCPSLQAIEGDLFNDLEIVAQVNHCLCKTIPTTYSHLFEGGYFNMPSALMGQEGEMGLAFCYVSPYHIYSLRYQFSNRIEITGNYRVFRGIEDPILSPSGFGDRSDKGVNVKFAVLTPEDSNYVLPGVAIGFQDFLGTKNFQSRYFVLTQVFRNYNAEASLGYGKHRIRGFFGGITWFPFLDCNRSFFKSVALSAEYDATPYKSKKYEPHPGGHSRKSQINFGLKYRFYNFLDLSASYVRGEKLALGASVFYNLGYTPGFQCKRDDPLPPPPQTIGPLDDDDELVQLLVCPFKEQCFDLQEVWLSEDCCGNKNLRLTILNERYRYECDIRYRLNDLLAATIPSDISNVVIVLDTQGFPIQEYHFPMDFVRMYQLKKVGTYELHVLSPLCDVSFPNPCQDRRLYFCKRDLWNINVTPKYVSFFGSAKGKYKYAVGVTVWLDGFLWKDVYYSLQLGYDFYKNLYDIKDVDKLNPSQLINVRTDIINYLKQDGVTVDEAYLQKSWNLGNGWFSRASVGLFEIEYGGLAAEILWYPMQCNFAFGFEAAILRKRTFSGVGFTDSIRKLHGYHPSYQKFLGSQAFFNTYYHFDSVDIDLELNTGKFLANDVGTRILLTKTYPSGTAVSIWCTYTNGNDKINGRRYYDKGIEVSIPLDIFYSYSSKKQWKYAIAAWLRDVGAVSATGKTLYRLIRDERN